VTAVLEQPPGIAAFQAACLELLGHFYPATDRELAVAAIGVACARTPRSGPLDAALRAFVTAVVRDRLVGAGEAESPELARAAKRDVIGRLLAQGAARLVVDAAQPGVSVPPQYKQVRDLGLSLGYGLKPPIPELESGTGLDDPECIRATLSFNGRPFPCEIPLDAVWGATLESTGQGVAWPQSAPPGWASSPAVTSPKPAGGVQAAARAKPAPPARPKLGLVPLSPELAAGIDATIEEIGARAEELDSKFDVGSLDELGDPDEPGAA
jgi:stringent starvation protein B